MPLASAFYKLNHAKRPSLCNESMPQRLTNMEGEQMPILKMPGWSKEQVDDAFDQLAAELGIRSPVEREQDEDEEEEDGDDE